MDKLDKKRNETEKYIIRFIIGLILLGFVIGFRNYVDTNDTVEKSQNLGGLYYTFDLFYYAVMVIGFSISVFLILPSLIFMIKRLTVK